MAGEDFQEGGADEGIVIAGGLLREGFLENLALRGDQLRVGQREPVGLELALSQSSTPFPANARPIAALLLPSAGVGSLTVSAIRLCGGPPCPAREAPRPAGPVLSPGSHAFPAWSLGED